MIITNCPKCGSMNITTAGVCANCGWSQLTESTVSTRITSEIEIMLSGKALLDDYKRLLLENRNLKERIAELESARRWIPVSERLPELDQDVFAVVEGEIKVGHFYQELDFIEPDDDEEGNISFSVFDDGLLVATHWFPIPDGLEER